MSEPNETEPKQLDPKPVLHPTLKQFKSALDSRMVGRALIDTFDKWRNNPGKCAPGSELKEAADALWARFQVEMGGHPSAPSAARKNSTPKPLDKRAQGRGSGPRGSSGPPRGR